MTALRIVSHALLSGVLLMASSAWAAGPKGTVPGYLDLKTGAFTTNAQAAAPIESPEAAVYNGTLTLKFNITLKSGFPTESEILCSQSDTVTDSAGSYHANKTVRAARSGSTATCTVSVFYSWYLSSPSQVISQTYYVLISNPSSGGINYQAQAASLTGMVEMPANNGSVSKTVNVTL